jgi:hypothetical protein
MTSESYESTEPITVLICHSADELHPQLFRRDEIIDSGAPLLRRLRDWRERER